MENNIKTIEDKLKSSKYFINKKDTIGTSYIFSDLQLLKVNDNCIKVIGKMECFWDDVSLEFLNERQSNKTTIISARTNNKIDDLYTIYQQLEYKTLNGLKPISNLKFYELRKTHKELWKLLKKLDA